MAQGCASALRLNFLKNNPLAPMLFFVCAAYTTVAWHRVWGHAKGGWAAGWGQPGRQGAALQPPSSHERGRDEDARAAHARRGAVHQRKCTQSALTHAPEPPGGARPQGRMDALAGRRHFSCLGEGQNSKSAAQSGIERGSQKRLNSLTVPLMSSTPLFKQYSRSVLKNNNE
jgi:hypothetical protein